jgi:hypothetical protein
MTDEAVERSRCGFMPNRTVPQIRSMVPSDIDHGRIEMHAVVGYVYSDLNGLNLLKPGRNVQTLVALVGVQSHQFHDRIGQSLSRRGE